MSTTHRCPHCGAAVPKSARFCQDCGRDTASKKSGVPAKTAAIVATALIVLAGAIFGGLQLAEPQAPTPSAAKEHPTQIMGAGQMPVWLLSADRQIQEDYIWAASHLEELQYIPCYCGCTPFGHTDNFSCYFKRNEKGAITAYDNHAVG